MPTTIHATANSAALSAALSAAPVPVITLTPRQEAFCQAMVANVGGAEAARRAGYSPKGAKQRSAYLMSQPEIRIRIDQLRASRSSGIQADLEEAAETVKAIISEAMEKKSLSLAFRAVELRLKLRGVIQDRRIPHHFIAQAPHPDADLERLDFDPAEDDDHRRDGRRDLPEAVAPALPPSSAPKPGMKPKLVTRHSDPRAGQGRRFGDTLAAATSHAALMPVSLLLQPKSAFPAERPSSDRHDRA
ncbi:terminase small subunit [Skermanella sp. TT6]|uniref:Terminase small subunit n=1 Tax=Skermanella cutis TaxID=2775420 RepID=A0ABX7B976_9PROT|nr:terminase small subunit [Skermanella sp. TT6]QQP90165.1 terminase small subunit [Skermanella sp. TT6]